MTADRFAWEGSDEDVLTFSTVKRKHELMAQGSVARFHDRLDALRHELAENPNAALLELRDAAASDAWFACKLRSIEGAVDEVYEKGRACPALLAEVLLELAKPVRRIDFALGASKWCALLLDAIPSKTRQTLSRKMAAAGFGIEDEASLHAVLDDLLCCREWTLLDLALQRQERVLPWLERQQHLPLPEHPALLVTISGICPRVVHSRCPDFFYSCGIQEPTLPFVINMVDRASPFQEAYVASLVPHLDAIKGLLADNDLYVILLAIINTVHDCRLDADQRELVHRRVSQYSASVREGREALLDLLRHARNKA